MKIATFFEPVSNLSRKQKALRLFLFFILFTDILTRTLNVDSILVERIIDALMGLCLVAFIFEMLFLKSRK
jgi:hypothetical protein